MAHRGRCTSTSRRGPGTVEKMNRSEPVIVYRGARRIGASYRRRVVPSHSRKTMNMIRKLSAVTLVITSAIVSAAPSAHAQSEPDRPGVSVGLLLGYGFDDAYKFGLGARGGYTLPQKVYIGGTFVYHFGESQSDGSTTASEHLFYLGPEGGYDFAIPGAPILVRPYLGLGFESVSVSVSGPEFNGTTIGGGSASGLSFWPGVTGLYSITPNISAG